MLVNNKIISQIEWEAFSKPIVITNIPEDERLPNGQKKINVSRDEEYNLKASLEFSDQNFFRPRELRTEAGIILQTFDIPASDSKYSYVFKSALLTSGKTTGMPGSVSFSGEVDVHFNGLIMKARNTYEGVHLSEWYLNGPRDHVFSKVTERKVLRRNYSRARMNSKEEKIDSIDLRLDEEYKESGEFGIDFLFVTISDLRFLIAKVPKGFGPQWSPNISIEYRNEWGRIPNLSEREKIVNLCSFILGRQLLSIGYTLYDQKEIIVEAYAQSPWGHSAKSLCSQPDYPPINIETIPPIQKTELVISKLLPNYFELETRLCLKEALWNYWISKQMPLGTNLPIIAAGIESISNAWFRSKKSKSKGLYLSNEEFGRLINEEIQKITKKLEPIVEGQKVIAKILRANEFGMIDNYRKFFQEIGLILTDDDWNALTGRHIFVHGGVLFDKTDWNKVSHHSNVFETLFSKTILKVLGYSGDYVDRSTIGWPNSNLT